MAPTYVIAPCPERLAAPLLLSLQVATPENKSVQWTMPSICKPASKRILVIVQLTLHATRRTPQGASRLVLAMLAWSVKSRPAPSRHYTDAGVYDHSTTTMRNNEYIPPSSTLREHATKEVASHS